MSKHFDFDDEFSSPADYARFYRTLGLQVVPAFLPGETRYWKRPALETWKPLSKTIMTDDEFDVMYGEKGKHLTRKNLGILTGSCSNGVFVLDLDTHKKDFSRLWFEDMMDNYNRGKPLDAPTQITGGGGKQLLLRAPPNWSAPTSKRPDLGIDIRGEGGFAMMAPSLHESGRHYEWEDDFSPSETPIIYAPDWLLHEINQIFHVGKNSKNNANPRADRQPSGKTKYQNCENQFGQKTDGREDYMKSLVCARMTSLYRAGHSNPTESELQLIFNELWTSYESKVENRLKDPRFSKRELLEREGRGPSLMWEKLRYLHDSWDKKVAELAAEQRETQISHDQENSSNNEYENADESAPHTNNSRDERDRSKGKNKLDHLQLAQKTIELIGRENIIISQSGVWMWSDEGVWRKSYDEQIKKYIHRTLSILAQSVTAALTGGILQVLKTEIFFSGHKFNVGNPEIINCVNGELELSEGEWRLVPHRRELYRTSQIPVAFNPNADAPRFRQFLDEIWRDDADKASKVKALLEMIGYSFVSHARYEKFIILIGAGANGKSVLLSTLQALLGQENIAAVQPSNFDRAFQRAHLDQKLANIISEIAQGEMIADAELKAITSGEPSTVEHKYGSPFVMHPFATCWFGTNHIPRTKDFSDALFRRALVITFNRIFPESEQDALLKEKLREELPGILALALNAYARALEIGFTEPESSLAAKQEWRKEVDQVAQFVDECCAPDPGAEVMFGDLFQAYSGWAAEEGIQMHMSRKGLRGRLCRLGYGERRSRQARFVTGLRLIAKTLDDEDFG